MKYNEIIGLNDYFQPAYDLTNEVGNYWKQFITNDKYFDVLRGVLSSLEGQRPDERKSIWLQGTYGTGKSHATAVIKHLLFDPKDEIGEFIGNFGDTQLKSRILNLRNQLRVFPVILKGTSNIIDNRTFTLSIEKAVKRALKQNNIKISTKSDFEKMIHQIETNPWHISWETVIQEYPQINMFVKDKEDLLKKLRDEDLTVLKNLEHLSSTIGIHFSYSEIANWLNEVIEELRGQGKADSLMIYWDEFTSVLELPSISVLLTELQNIAELSVNKGVYLFMVSHRTPSQAKITKEDMEKVLGRFRMLDYSMEPITTYHIVGAAIKKKDKSTWESLKDEKSYVMDDLIRRIVGTDGGVRDYTLLKNLFPIHPYTAYLSTFIVRNIGSTERSIFEFLYDEERGFSKFIKENPSGVNGVFLTVDYLWDFFMEEFERIDYQKFSSILDKYKLHIQAVEEENRAYSAIFKGVLLLNIQYKMVKVAEARDTLVAPSATNIKSMFWGTEYENDIEAALNFFDSRQIIPKNPDNLFLVSSSSLPLKEIEKEKEGLKGLYNQIDKILSKEQVKEIHNTFTNSVLRKTELKIFDASLNEYLLKNMLRKAFVKDYALHIVVLIAKNIQEREQIKVSVRNILKDTEFINIVFIVLEELFGEDILNQFVDYQARAIIAERHNYTEERISNEDYARKFLDRWIHLIKSGYAEWYLKRCDDLDNKLESLSEESNGKCLVKDFSEVVNEELSAKIFSSGLEVLKETKKNHNVWTGKMAKASAENFLFANNRDFIETKTSSGPERYTREIIKDNFGDYIVDEGLQFKKEVDVNHPTIKMNSEIQKIINRKKDSGVFNLGDTLKFLTKPPFGLYPNMLHMATLGFLMMGYVGKLYETGRGKPIEKEIMRDKILDLFKYWEGGRGSNKLEVRLGTAEEKKLITDLTGVFNLRDIESLNDLRWGIREWIKESQYPLWVFKLSEDANEEIKLAIDEIIELIESMDTEISRSDIKNVLDAVKVVETDLKFLIFKKEKIRELFIAWLKNIENVEIRDEEIDNVIAYIRRNMPEEIGVYSWKEDNIRERVKDWYIKKSKPQPGQTYENEGRDQGYTDDFTSEHNKESRRTAIIEKIEAYQGDWKSVLKKLISEHDELISILEKYL
ncbi:MAG: hypothetical protein JRI72_01160 [Deltaproteobacteria bacterium]|nr:hypothetical protein [Deltaproteobacteria bacterium]